MSRNSPTNPPTNSLTNVPPRSSPPRIHTGPQAGVIVNRTLLCENPHCPGVIQTKQGPEAVRMLQIHYSKAPVPNCPYCQTPMYLESMHARNEGHQSRREQHQVMSKTQDLVFDQAERTGHRLAENSREGDQAKAIITPEARKFIEGAQASGLPALFNVPGQNLQQKVQTLNAYAKAGKGLARQTKQDGAHLPMSYLAAGLGNIGMTGVPESPTEAIRGAGNFWRTGRKG